MTTRSKHADPRAVAYNAWQQHVWEQAWLALRDQGWSADDGPLYPRGVRLAVTVIIWLYRRGQADTDNLYKGIVDALQSKRGTVRLLANDSQIDTHQVYLRPAATVADERVTVIVSPIADAWTEAA